ncbi:branched-chain amino acid transport system permease protein [Desulfonatronum thiosulfatophilum]|uniref:Branched-chain amino acid transport system permease protein n=1 Tax=Desulfonatronum thiosulfatophilum TaxID=617002 RepID=A0A1G6EHY1_9BACT|nr:branched-chain amino acid ABC transporter permease [Desulfonatronum thiosulfatophilum]SDB57006.1 branched-chain amino acid transport system permease protein [Desulfonatronum thiosulfatophilum]
MELSSFLQFLVAGLTVGSTYGLAALGFTIIFNTTGIINFAQGEFVMLGGILSVIFVHWLDPGLPVAVILAVFTTTLVGLVMERLTIRPVQHASVINLIIVTIGVSITIRGVMMLLWGKDTYVLPAFSGNVPIPFLGATIAPQSLWILGITMMVLASMRYFFSRTIFGRAMLACSFEPKAARLMGISVEKMVMASFMLSAFVGAVGGAILTPLTMTSYDVGVLLGLKGFAACILGGLGNPFGAAAGGLILGVLEAFGAGMISSAYKDAIAFVVILAILLWRPSGLFGAPDTERV